MPMLNQDPIEYAVLRAARFAADKHRLQRLVKLTDLKANGADVAVNPPAEWSEDRRQGYPDWARKVASGCRGLNSRLDAKFAEMVGWDA
jgi:hypothetical protein